MAGRQSETRNADGRVNASDGDIVFYFDKVTNFTLAGHMSARAS